MIKAYLTWISTAFEGEEAEIRYRIFKNEELLDKNSMMIDYVKPAIVGHVSTLALLKKLEAYRNQEIVIIINDGALYESVRGTSATKNKDVQMMSKKVRDAISKFDNVIMDNVSGDYTKLTKWNEILKP